MEVVITSSPGLIPIARRPISRASRPLETPTVPATSQAVAHEDSKADTCLPRTHQPDRITSSTTDNSS